MLMRRTNHAGPRRSTEPSSWNGWGGWRRCQAIPHPLTLALSPEGRGDWSSARRKVEVSSMPHTLPQTDVQVRLNPFRIIPAVRHAQPSHEVSDNSSDPARSVRLPLPAGERVGVRGRASGQRNSSVRTPSRFFSSSSHLYVEQTRGPDALNRTLFGTGGEGGIDVRRNHDPLTLALSPKGRGDWFCAGRKLVNQLDAVRADWLICRPAPTPLGTTDDPPVRSAKSPGCA